MTKEDIINKIIKIFNHTSYLEIGVQNGLSFKKINIKEKVGVDPKMQYKDDNLYEMTSDEYFTNYKKMYDIIFIDGLHEASQCLKDIINASQALKPGGHIVCHDMLPSSKAMQQVPRIAKEWTGNSWKAWATIKKENPSLNMFIVDCDYGVGILHLPKIIQLNYNEVDAFEYKDYSLNKEKIMGEIIKPFHFEKRINII
jgi:hypothetical protein